MGDPNVDTKVAEQDAKIQAIYDALSQDLQSGVESTGKIFDTASKNTGDVYNTGLSDIQNITQSLQNRLNSSMSNLGIGTSYGTQMLADTLAANQARMVGQKTADLSALAGQGAAYKGVAQQFVGDSQREGARQRSELGTKLRSSLYDYLAQEERARADVEISRQEQEAAIRQLQMQLQGQQGEAALRLRQQQVALQQAQMDRAAAASQGSGDPLLDLKAEKLAAEIDKLRGGSNKVGKGLLGVQQWLAQQGIDSDSNEAQAISNIMSLASQQNWQLTQQGLNSDPYELSMNMINDPAYLNGADPNDVMTALQIMFGKTSYGG